MPKTALKLDRPGQAKRPPHTVDRDSVNITCAKRHRSANGDRACALAVRRLWSIQIRRTNLEASHRQLTKPFSLLAKRQARVIPFRRAVAGVRWFLRPREDRRGPASPAGRQESVRQPLALPFLLFFSTAATGLVRSICLAAIAAIRIFVLPGAARILVRTTEPFLICFPPFLFPFAFLPSAWIAGRFGGFVAGLCVLMTHDSQLKSLSCYNPAFLFFVCRNLCRKLYGQDHLWGERCAGWELGDLDACSIDVLVCIYYVNLLDLIFFFNSSSWM